MVVRNGSGGVRRGMDAGQGWEQVRREGGLLEWASLTMLGGGIDGQRGQRLTVRAMAASESHSTRYITGAPIASLMRATRLPVEGADAGFVHACGCRRGGSRGTGGRGPCVARDGEFSCGNQLMVRGGVVSEGAGADWMVRVCSAWATAVARRREAVRGRAEQEVGRWLLLRECAGSQRCMHRCTDGIPTSEMGSQRVGVLRC